MKTWKNEDQYIPVKSWCENLEDGAIEQANNLAKLPFAFHHVAIMADSHWGYGMPIGGVLATKDVIVPNAVGVDIGCGVSAHRTCVKYSQLGTDELKELMGEIRQKIPVGFNYHKEPRQLPPHLENEGEVSFAHVQSDGLKVSAIIDKARHQAGTLGGGNHFIELQKDESGFIWVMIHSGSRNVGYTIANHFNKLAKESNARWFSDTQSDLAFLPTETLAAYDYLEAMHYAVSFARYNRKLMINICINILEDEGCSSIDGAPQYDLNHNHVQLENHFGENVWVHRKGATQARKDEICLIPGSQGSNSYVGRGLGNPESFMSCSHGAGRKLSRTKARNELSLDDEKKILDDLGVIHSIRNKKDLDEGPSAYKDIHAVMREQSDLVEIIHELTPIAVIKG